METYVIKRLDQAKLLTDPFKLKLLERFAGDPVTTKQVADRLGEKAPRLYRHVEALAEAGLLTLVEERQKRGTTERYFRTVADRFEMDPGLFRTGDAAEDTARQMVRDMLADTAAELGRAFDAIEDIEAEADRLPLVVKASIRATPDQIQKLRQKLKDWVEECSELCGGEDLDEQDSYHGLVALYQSVDEPGSD